MSDHRITESKPTPSRRWLRLACIGSLLACSAVACRNEPTQTTEPLRPGAAGGASTTEGEDTRGMGTTGSGTRTSTGGTHSAPLSGSGSGNPGASANDIDRTGGSDSERTGSGGTSGRTGGGGHGGTAGHGGRGGTAGTAGR